MPEVTNELIYEVLKSVQERLGNVEDGQRTIRDEIGALRTHMSAMQQDINNLYTVSKETSSPIERIEKRLELNPAT